MTIRKWKEMEHLILFYWTQMKIQYVYRRRQNLKIHLDENTKIHVNVLEQMKSLNDSKFVREVAQKIWGTEKLKMRCLSPRRANKGKQDGPEEELRKPLTPVKYQLLQDCLDNKLVEEKVKPKQRAKRMLQVSTYMRAKLYDVRRK
ncbi:uncharacterized protein LOC122504077 [Leptopilina heterotoma]|uniref:uncharacterized protein LOC122504077 n=1 Tax=Leptopilina heterotoma TaxID=63436 RepID=UPI001CA87251|nr:uncharacterized protein LOC122504077 [Leptopilina heterotoma]